MGFELETSVPVIVVFLQGLLSFFSPCVLPLIPLYIGYLSGGTGQQGEDGRIYYKRSKVMLHTVCFIIGVSFAFFILGFGVSTLGSFLKSNQLLFARMGGILIILFGLFQIGVFGQSKTLGKERRLPIKINAFAMSPVVALIMGFTFSFAWTPCVGPALASVLLMAASSATKVMGFVLIGVYTIGFVLPFLAVGLFTTTLLELFKKYRNVVKYTVKIGGVLLVVMGLLILTGKMNAITGYLSKFTGPSISQNTDNKETSTDSIQEDTTKETDNIIEESNEQTSSNENTSNEVEELPDAIDFTLTDQYGNIHRLSDYKGKTVFLNFWATWCSPCRAEMPDIQKIYETYDSEGEDGLVVLGIAAPDYGGEVSEEEIKQFLSQNGYTYPVVMDTTGEIFEQYGVYSYPTTFMITKEGKVFGYASGQLTEDIMISIIEQTMSGKRN